MMVTRAQGRCLHSPDLILVLLWMQSFGGGLNANLVWSLIFVVGLQNTGQSINKYFKKQPCKWLYLFKESQENLLLSGPEAEEILFYWDFFILPVSQAVEGSVRLFVGSENLPPHCIEWHTLEGKQEIIMLESITNSHDNKRTATVCVSLERNLSTLYLPGFSDNN